MAKKQKSKEKASKKKSDVINKLVEDAVNEAEKDIRESLTGNNVSFIDNSFPDSVNYITGISAATFGDIKANIERVGPHGWHKPYIEVLKQHGFDMIFFSYDPPLTITTEVGIEDYEFKDLPTGKCVVMGRDSANNFKCGVALMNDDHRARLLYDPSPESSYVELFNFGFFIKTFIDVEAYIDVTPDK